MAPMGDYYPEFPSLYNPMSPGFPVMYFNSLSLKSDTFRPIGLSYAIPFKPEILARIFAKNRLWMAEVDK